MWRNNRKIMRILDYLRPMKVYTAAEVHAEITAKVVLLMEEMKKQVEEVSLPVEMQSELELLRTTGLTNSRNMQALTDAENHVNKINEERKMTAERIKLIQLLHKHYGKDVMLMRLEDFMALLDKYNLSCGFLSDYTGSIPRKNLEEIAKGKMFLDKLNPLDKMRETWSEAQMLLDQSLQRYGINNEGVCIDYEEGLFLRNNIDRWHYVVECTKEYIKEHPDIHRFPFVKAKDKFFYSMITTHYSMSSATTRQLIAAPAQEMNNAPKIRERIRTEDPFVFSVAKQGVIIYSTWGDEGNDELVQKYRKINEWIASCEALKRLEE